MEATEIRSSLLHGFLLAAVAVGLAACGGGGSDSDATVPVVSVPPVESGQAQRIIEASRRADGDLARVISGGLVDVEPLLERIDRCAGDRCLQDLLPSLRSTALPERRGLQERVDQAWRPCLQDVGTAYVSALSFSSLADVYGREGRLADARRVIRFAREDLARTSIALERCAAA